MIAHDPFEIAPLAPRHTRASWMVLGCGVLFAAASAWPLYSGLQALAHASKAAEDSRRAVQERQARDTASRRREQDPVLLEKMNAQLKLQQILRMSWSGLFDALELAGKEVDGGATIISLTPVKTRADAAQVDITALAVSIPVMIDYLRALEKNKHVSDVQLTMQELGGGAGVQLVRFRFSLLWNPSAATPAAPAAMRTRSPVPVEGLIQASGSRQ